MDDTFGLENLSEEQTLERLESLFESASSFPNVRNEHNVRVTVKVTVSCIEAAQDAFE